LVIAARPLLPPRGENATATDGADLSRVAGTAEICQEGIDKVGFRRLPRRQSALNHLICPIGVGRRLAIGR
jgi:hypothetical protein